MEEIEEIGLEQARPHLGEIVDKARLADIWTVVTRQGKPAAVVVSFTGLLRLMDHAALGDRAVSEWLDRGTALRKGRRIAQPPSGKVVQHRDGDPYNNDPANLEIVDPKENGDA